MRSRAVFRGALSPLVSAVLAAGVLVAAPGPAHAAEPTPVLKTAAGEFQPTRGGDYLAWQENTRKRARAYNIYARRVGGPKFKVNAKKTNGANGSISGSRLVYQQYKKKKSNIRFFNLSTRKRRRPPKRVNSRHWEYWPSVSGKWLLFGRLKGNGDRGLILFDLQTKKTRVLDEVGKKSFITPGQVNGPYVVWSRCTPSDRCNVIRYRITDGQRTRIENPNRYQRSPSVSPEGTVYFVRSGRGCGNRVRLMRYSPHLGPEVLTRLPRGGDIASTKVFSHEDGSREVFYEHNVCSDPVGSDIWKVVEPDMVSLAVTTKGNGRGTVTSAPGGIQCGTNCTYFFDTGTEVTLTAVPEEGSIFGGWNGTCSGEDETCTVTMSEAQSLTANFATPDLTLTVTKTGAGAGRVVSTPTGIDCGTDCSESYDFGTSVQLAVTANSGSLFAGWSGDCAGAQSTCTVSMDGVKTVTADFITGPTVSVTNEGTGTGRVTSSPAGIDCGTTCRKTYPSGTSVTLTAAASTGSTFVDWGGACSGSATTCTVVANTPKTVIATFTRIEQKLTVTKSGGGSGTVTSNPVGIDCGTDCDHTYTFGTNVALTATPTAGSSFSGWSGACTGTGACDIDMNGPESVTATFTIPDLSVALDGTGSGTVTSGEDPPGISCEPDCSQTYEDGDQVTLTAAPDQASSTFTGWGGDCASAGNQADCTLTIDGAKTVTATFAINEHTLTVNKDGTGTVTSNTGNINCGTTCSDTYDHGSIVELTTAADTGSTFTGWSDPGCPGTGTCSVTMDGPETVTATFTLGPIPIVESAPASARFSVSAGLLAQGAGPRDSGDRELISPKVGISETSPPQNETSPFHPRSRCGVVQVFYFWMTVNHREAHNLFSCNGVFLNRDSPREARPS